MHAYLKEMDVVISLRESVQSTISDAELRHVLLQRLQHGLGLGQRLPLLGPDELLHLQALALYGAGQFGEHPLTVLHGRLSRLLVGHLVG